MTALPEDALVVVADGEGARVFRNRGEKGAISLHQYELLELVNLNDDGPAGSMPGESTSRQLDEATFAKQLAKGLNDAALKQQYAHLILVADPKTLGRVRPLLHKEATQRIVAEVGKDLTNVPLEDIERTLAAA
ncbi:Protein required for attachment to host cells [Pseudoxanthomonas sp. CF385]|uniref:host attachment family protein n=1 Tax=Pseudoxanthomonas sp. CF385 TaxID=1881042 RepID=UPI00088A6367|nr:host attachment family protein [Pseudoxanthomonas sp. CF385]SDQ66793.1 Protein required for attachment to host cells [Pseudoxanthomonas sp. CF385]